MDENWGYPHGNPPEKSMFNIKNHQSPAVGIEMGPTLHAASMDS